MAVATCAAVLCWAGCENDPKEVAALGKRLQEVEEGRNINGIFSQSAELKAVLKAPLMYRVKADTLYTEFPKTIRVEFYKENRALESVLRAGYAKHYETLGKVLLRDSVKVYSTNGDTLYCKNLWWDQNQQIFYTDDSVAIRTLTQQQNGTGLWAKADFSQYTIKNIFGLMAIPDSVKP